MLTRDQETIIAQCTPSGPGALALLRLSGDNALEIADHISSLGAKKISQVPTHTIHYGSVRENNTIIDQVLFFVMHGPQTFTGQNTVEITCHNNPFIIQSIIQAAIAAGARLADNGEFTKRSVLQGKIDLIKAEAIQELIHATTQHAVKKSLQQLKGTFSEYIASIEKKLIKALALSEASFEFIDEEHMTFEHDIRSIISSVMQTIAQLKITFDQQRHIKNGMRIALIGSVNAGKSSLFNALLGTQRAIVANEAGTTRDVIEAGVYKQGAYWTLIDTAGIRETAHAIEQEGIKRSFYEAEQADIILLVYDGSREMIPQEQDVYNHLYEKFNRKIILIRSKTDISNSPLAWLSAKNYLSYDHQNTTAAQMIEDTIQSKIVSLFESHDSPFLVNKRQFNLLLKFEQKLQSVQTILASEPITYELMSYHITDALSELAELTGKSICEAGMDAVFREFCVGK